MQEENAYALPAPNHPEKQRMASLHSMLSNVNITENNSQSNSLAAALFKCYNEIRTCYMCSTISCSVVR